MRLTPEQRFRLEMMKDQTPSTNHFVWLIPLFLLIVYVCKNDAIDDAVQVHKWPVAHVGDQPFSKYTDNDPLCGGDTWCFLGWRL